MPLPTGRGVPWRREDSVRGAWPGLLVCAGFYVGPRKTLDNHSGGELLLFPLPAQPACFRIFGGDVEADVHRRIDSLEPDVFDANQLES